MEFPENLPSVVWIVFNTPCSVEFPQNTSFSTGVYAAKLLYCDVFPVAGAFIFYF